jgi:hypothetical protein
LSANQQYVQDTTPQLQKYGHLNVIRSP